MRPLNHIRASCRICAKVFSLRHRSNRCSCWVAATLCCIKLAYHCHTETSSHSSDSTASYPCLWVAQSFSLYFVLVSGPLAFLNGTWDAPSFDYGRLFLNSLSSWFWPVPFGLFPWLTGNLQGKLSFLDHNRRYKAIFSLFPEVISKGYRLIPCYFFNREFKIHIRELNLANREVLNPEQGILKLPISRYFHA